MLKIYNTSENREHINFWLRNCSWDFNFWALSNSHNSFNNDKSMWIVCWYLSSKLELPWKFLIILSQFLSFQVSLGLIGIITEVTFQCVPTFNLEEISEPTGLSNCIQNMDEIIHSAPFVKLWVEIYSSKCVVFRYEKTDKPRQISNEISKMDLKASKINQLSLSVSHYISYWAAPRLVTKSGVYSLTY